RTRRFDLFEFNSSAFLEFAQTLDPLDPEDISVDGFPEVTPLMEDRIKDFADRYGPLTDDIPPGAIHPPLLCQWGRVIREWARVMARMHQDVKLWQKATVTGDFSRLITKVEKKLRVNLLLKKDPLSASPKLCIRPSTLEDALLAEFFLWIDGNDLGTCVQCRKWFALEAGKGRSDKMYCSDA